MTLLSNLSHPQGTKTPLGESDPCYFNRNLYTQGGFQGSGLLKIPWEKSRPGSSPGARTKMASLCDRPLLISKKMWYDDYHEAKRNSQHDRRTVHLHISARAGRRVYGTMRGVSRIDYKWPNPGGGARERARGA